MSESGRRAILGTLLPGFLGTELPDWLAALLSEGLGGVCLFGQNIQGREQTRALTDAILAANPDAIIAADEEGGDVTRLYYDRGSPYPGNALLGRIGELALTERTARAVGRQLRDVGVNADFAPVVDINSNPDNPVIGVRSFGTLPEQVADQAAAWVSALQSTGVAAAAKHFPGHGDTAQDSHLALPVVDRRLAQLRERELVPFQAAIGAGARMIMTSHILLPQLDPRRPATMSAPIITGLLRDELGFEGVVVSDALDMRGASGDMGVPTAAVRSLAAGVDLLCLGTGNTAEQVEDVVTAVVAAVAAGELGAQRVADAAARVRGLAVRLREVHAADPLAEVPAHEPEYDLDELVTGFDVTPAAAAWIQAGTARDACTVVRVEPPGNLAVGLAPWGPFAAGLGADLVLGAAGLPAAPPPGPLLVVGKDLHRLPYAREAIDAARSERGAQVLAVDQGWPSDDRAYADLATFGASRLVGRALLHLLGWEAEG